MSVTGDDDALASLLRGNSLVHALEADGGGDTVEVVAAARADYRRLLTALYAEGHYAGTISIRLDGREAAVIAPLDAPRDLQRVEIVVDPGPRFTFGALSLAPMVATTQLPEGFVRGEVARSTLIEEAAQAVVDGWRHAGHPLARITAQDIRAIHADNRLDAAITIAEGPRLNFGPLAVAGNERMRSERITAIAGLPEGDIYDPEAVERAALRLRRTGVFASAALIEGAEPGPNATLPVTAQVQELPLRRLGFGAELSSVEGLSLTAFWLHRNLWGGAERLRLEASISGIEGSAGLGHSGPDLRFAVAFSRPATLGPDTDLTADLAVERLDEPAYLLTRSEARVGLTRHSWYGATYQADFGLIVAREETPARTRDYVLATVPLSATLDRRDEPLDATRGWYADVHATPFVGLSGAGTGARIHADARFYHSFGEARRLTLALRGQAGTVVGADIFEAPADFLFHSGGGGTVRGQPYQSLGLDLTRDFGSGPAAIRLGGRSFIGIQAETRLQVTDSISAVGFYDFGMIDFEPMPGSDSPWHAGAGLGLRYATAIGPIRLDLATPASGPDAGESVHVYIGIGQAF